MTVGLRRISLGFALAALVVASVAACASGKGGEGWEIRDLGTRLAPQKLNDRGQILGTTVVTVNGERQSHAVIWDDDQMIDLTPNLPLNRAGPSGCHSVDHQESVAVATNGRGRILVAATNECGLVTPPGAWLWQDGGLVGLPTLGGQSSTPSDMNVRGEVVGASSTGREGGVSGSIRHAALWQDGRVRDLGTLGGTESEAVDINEVGQVVGFSDTRNGRRHAFLWKKGGMVDLGIGDTRIAINDVGHVLWSRQVAGHDSHGAAYRHAFLFKDGKVRDLGTLGGATSHGWDINDRDEVVGSSGTSRETGSAYPDDHAFVAQNGEMTDLGTLGGQNSFARAINERGQIVGTSETSAEWQRTWRQGLPIAHAFVWQNGAMTDLGTLPGGGESEAIDINDRGQIVGTVTTVTGRQHAVLWTNTDP